MTALELASRALHEHRSMWPWEDAGRGVQACAVSEARAVLMAIREPDGDMLGAGDKVFNHGCHGSTWTVMIDAILNEKDTTND